MTNLKSPVTLIILVAVCLFLIWLAFGRGCGNIKKGDTSAADSLRIMLVKYDSAMLVIERMKDRADTSTAIIRQQDEIISQVVEQKEKSDQQLATTKVKLKESLSALNKAYEQQDTASIVTGCDELRRDVEQQQAAMDYHQALFDEYKEQQEVKQVEVDRKDMIQDSIILAQNGLLLSTKSGLQYAAQEIEAKDKESRKLRRKLRVEKTLSRLESIGLIVLGALLLTKK